MTLKELKHLNLRRLCLERGIDGGALAKLLGAQKQHGSQLLSGKSGIGDATIRKLAKLWEIDEIEFVKIPESTKTIPIGWNDDLIDLCGKVREVINYGEPYASALRSNILCFEDSINIKRELKNLQAVTSKGPASGTPEEPVGSTGS